MTDEESRKAFEEYRRESEPFEAYGMFPSWYRVVEWATKRERERCVAQVEFVKAHADSVHAGMYDWVLDLIVRGEE
jgi:hypothetical protein